MRTNVVISKVKGVFLKRLYRQQCVSLETITALMQPEKLRRFNGKLVMDRCLVSFVGGKTKYTISRGMGWFVRGGRKEKR
ncbi:MAG TPA: hypothetical protein DCF91_03155, partial [Porphyromonadaceae bacterium]|nr:hypothetical protein [Porphyromonadaceae bacterium]